MVARPDTVDERDLELEQARANVTRLVGKKPWNLEHKWKLDLQLESAVRHLLRLEKQAQA